MTREKVGLVSVIIIGVVYILFVINPYVSLLINCVGLGCVIYWIRKGFL